MSKQKASASALDKALTDPSEVFDGPEQVVHDARFGTADKLRILERWEIDAKLLQVATEENMGGNVGEDGALLQRVRRSLDALAVRSKPSPPGAGTR